MTKPAAHIPLNFSVQYQPRLTNQLMVCIACECLEKMEYKDTQYVIACHHHTNHPHIHIAINRIDNNGKRISDQNEKLQNRIIFHSFDRFIFSIY